MQLRKPSPSMAVAMTALTISLGGTSYAAVKITGKNVKNNSLTSADIKNRSLKSKDFKKGQLPKGQDGDLGAQGPAGLQGPAGTPGVKGDKGDTGAAGAGRWVLVNALGQIEAQSGGFTVSSAYNLTTNAQQPTPAGAVGNVYIDANEPLGNNGIVASIALQNTTDQGGPTNPASDPPNQPFINGRAPGGDANPEFSGEITATKCNTAFTACAPNLAKFDDNFVVSPRNSDGSFTDGPAAPSGATDIGTRKRFYVIITGDSTDFLAPSA